MMKLKQPKQGAQSRSRSFRPWGLPPRLRATDSNSSSEKWNYSVITMKSFPFSIILEENNVFQFKIETKRVFYFSYLHSSGERVLIWNFAASHCTKTPHLRLRRQIELKHVLLVQKWMCSIQHYEPRRVLNLESVDLFREEKAAAMSAPPTAALGRTGDAPPPRCCALMESSRNVRGQKSSAGLL